MASQQAESDIIEDALPRMREAVMRMRAGVQRLQGQLDAVSAARGDPDAVVAAWAIATRTAHEIGLEP